MGKGRREVGEGRRGRNRWRRWGKGEDGGGKREEGGIKTPPLFPGRPSQSLHVGVSGPGSALPTPGAPQKSSWRELERDCSGLFWRSPVDPTFPQFL